MFVHRSIASKIFACFSLVIAVALTLGVVRNPGPGSDPIERTMDEAHLRGTRRHEGHPRHDPAQDDNARGYRLSHDVVFLDWMRTNEAALDKAVESLARLTIDNASETVRIGDLTKRLSAWRALLVSAPSASADIDALLSRVLQSVDDIAAEETRLLALRSTIETDAFAMASLLSVISPLSSFIAAVLLSIALAPHDRGTDPETDGGHAPAGRRRHERGRPQHELARRDRRDGSRRAGLQGRT